MIRWINIPKDGFQQQRNCYEREGNYSVFLYFFFVGKIDSEIKKKTLKIKSAKGPSRCVIWERPVNLLSANLGRGGMGFIFVRGWRLWGKIGFF